MRHPDEAELLARARAGDPAAFDRLASRHRRELRAHCYRMLGSPHDADDALQESLLAAWRGLASFEGRSSLRTWLYQVSTHACLRFIAQRPKRVLSPDHGPAFEQTAELGQPVLEPVWLEPWPDEDAADDTGGDDPAAGLQRRETVALAFVAALQHLPGTQRAVLILREVLEFSAAEVAGIVDTTVASVNSALQRAQKTMRERASAADELHVLGEEGARELLHAFLVAWESRNVGELVKLLAADARFTMPPLPAWFDGRDNVARFFAERVFQTPWRLRPIRANGQAGFACYMQAAGDDRYRLGAVNLLTVRDGRIAAISAFLDRAVFELFELAPELPA